ncbi:MAG: ATP-binding protein [Nanoarchaeota archaeon]|nr:ATP-binding protein [Nanoarchaeota archaeon]
MRLLSKFSNRIVLVFFIATLIPIILISLYGLNVAKQQVLDNLKLDFEENSLFVAEAVETSLSIDEEIISYLGENAHLKKYFIASDLNQTEIAEFELAEATRNFLEYTKSHPMFNQVRFIDKQGMEVIAIKALDSEARIAEDYELHNKSYAYFFKEAIGCGRLHPYISKMDLERLYGGVKEPHVLTLRYSSCVFDNEKNHRGMAVLNFNAGKILDLISYKQLSYHNMKPGAVTMIVDKDGYYIYHPNESKRFGGPNDLNTGYSLKKDYPLASEEVLSGESGSVIVENDIVAGYYKFNPGDGSRGYTIILGQEYDSALIPLVHIQKVTMIVIGLIIVFSLFSSIILARKFTAPIKDLVLCANKVAAGNFNVQANIRTNDEIQEFAKVFNTMIVNIKEREKEITSKTQELGSSKKEIQVSRDKLEKNLKRIQTSRKALLNIMEDMGAANIELKSLDKAKDEFLSIVSHELKTPITPMKTYIDMLIDGDFGKLTSKQMNSSRMIKRNLNRLQMLIDDLLDITRLATGRIRLIYEKINIYKLINRIANDKSKDPKAKDLKILVEGGRIPLINTDPTRIEQVLSNLLDNSIKFTPSGGSITISVKCKGKYIIVAVKDTGIGINKDNLQHVFEKFFQVDSGLSRKYGGTGLGLAICKGIIKLLHGDISIDAEFGKGTTVSFSLPIKCRK